MTNNLKDKIINYLNKEYSGIVRYETDRWSDSIFFMKDGKHIYEYNKKNRYVYVSYDKIWLLLESFFGLEFKEIQDLTREWVKEHYKLNTRASGYALMGNYSEVEEHYKLNTRATQSVFEAECIPVEEQYKLDIKTTHQLMRHFQLGVEEQYNLETNDQQT